jgi:tetratricopeptide (TPR) repeat protein
MGVPLLLPLLVQALVSGSDPAIIDARSKAENRSLPLSDRRPAYEQLIHTHPSDATLYADYASLLIANREPAQAFSWIVKGLAVAPNDVALRLRKGIVLHALGQPADSLKILQALPPSGEASFYMGLDCRSLRDHASAQKYLSEAWTLGLQDPYTLYSLIEEDHALGDKTSGLRHFQSFLEHFSDSPWLHVLYANAYAQKDKDEAARKEYQEALRLNPELPGVNFRLGYLMYVSGEYSAAIDCFRKELAINPSYSDASLFLGQSLRQKDRHEEALPYFRQAIALDPRSELAYRALVSALTDKGDLDAAAEVLGKAEKEFPADASFPAQLARILTKLNRQPEALREQEKFRSLKQSQK